MASGSKRGGRENDTFGRGMLPLSKRDGLARVSGSRLEQGEFLDLKGPGTLKGDILLGC